MSNSSAPRAAARVQAYYTNGKWVNVIICELCPQSLATEYRKLGSWNNHLYTHFHPTAQNATTSTTTAESAPMNDILIDEHLLEFYFSSHIAANSVGAQDPPANQG
ncbi:hypothetical protein O1611_g5235 [Lasiodiplodia mahajangana]|uniref:Uncharacterized protein n=1 Tax=Lasiodiplodia mahajangana TaxID=1108764 RepID=A0ACC2JME9_9PEZI|nr:hypothetical protein O1611_g5235 [Lasiodiplodia mahajangana]